MSDILKILKAVLLITGIITLSAGGLFSQKTAKEYELDGDAYFNTGRYFPAVEAYRNALQFNPANASLSYKYAEALSHSLNYCKAIKWYEKTIALTDTMEYPLCLYKLAVARKNCGNYEKAKEDFMILLKYLRNNPRLAEIKDQIIHELKSVDFALKHMNDTIIFSVEHLPAPVNTPYSEFNPIEIPGGKLVYSSYTTLFADSFQNIFSQSYISKIMISQRYEGGWQKPVDFSGKINSNRWFTANICFADNYKTIYFTRCYDNDGLVGRCMIFKSHKRKGKWSKPVKLPPEINMPSTSSTQPFLAEGKEYDILFFVSDRPGGYGKNDIWYSILKNGEFSDPSNLGININTVGNEVTPFYDIEKGTLYFSSDWHEGFGGFDIFKSNGGFNQWGKPVNMGIPVNSENNDLYYTPGRSGNDAYLSSNRKGSFYHEGSNNCCGDIYYVIMEEKEKTASKKDTVRTPPPTVEQKIRKLLPITLYFDNDIPDPGSLSDTTSSNYKDLLDRYFTQKDKYRREYSKGLKGKTKSNAVDTINDFFENYVGAGFRDLELLKNLLISELDSGKNVKIMVKGYASPLNTAEYNYHLSKRRITTMINFLLSADSGRFVPYYEGRATNGGKLTIYQDPRGDRSASKYVSDNPNDKRNSVYSKSAALERRIQITMYSSGEETAKDFDLPVISFKSDSFNIGTIDSNDVKTGMINFGNTGKSELKIIKLTSNRKNIQLQLKENNISSGKTGTIYFMIKTKGLKPGSYNSEITIESNAGKMKITVKYNVRN